MKRRMDAVRRRALRLERSFFLAEKGDAEASTA
jgi:hypothetical protein